MSRPFIISVTGANGIGVSTACERLYHALRHKYAVNIINMKTRNNVMRFEDDMLSNAYSNFDVLIIDSHPYVSSALNRNLRQSLFDSESVKPNISFVMTCRFDTYKDRIGKTTNTTYRLLDNYATSKSDFFGTPNHYRIACDGNDGQLMAAGKMLSLVKRELKQCK